MCTTKQGATTFRKCEPVQFADWAAPIVPVMKPCGDYDVVTISRAAKVDSYPIPRIEERSLPSFTWLMHTSRHSWMKIQGNVTINTHKGLYKYNRLQWALTLSAYNYMISYKPGENHANADVISRLQIKTWTNRDPLLFKV